MFPSHHATDVGSHDQPGGRSVAHANKHGADANKQSEKMTEVLQSNVVHGFPNDSMLCEQRFVVHGCEMRHFAFWERGEK